MLCAEISFENYNDKIEYINECEKAFAFEVEKAKSNILCHDNLKIIYVCGPSCSGKTTASDMLISGLSKNGKRIEIISVDDYYKNREIIKEECRERNSNVDYESLSAIDFTLFKETLYDLNTSKAELQIPIFDFKTGKRKGFRNISNSKDTVILFEGIQTVYPEITSLLEGYETEGVRIGVFEDICVGNNVLSMTNARLIRRIVRDVYKRNTSPSETLHLWDSVRQNEITNIEPYIKNVKIKINSFLGYEISAMRTRALEHLATVSDNDIHYESARELLKIITPAENIENSLIPDNSIIREFLI